MIFDGREELLHIKWLFYHRKFVFIWLDWRTWFENFELFQKGSPEETNGNEKTLGRLLKLDNNEWFVDDRTELTIGYRLKDSQKLGIPIVIAFGKRAVGFILYKYSSISSWI